MCVNFCPGEKAFTLQTLYVHTEVELEYTTGCIMKSERQFGNWSWYQSLPLCICAFVSWSSKTSTAIVASHRIGLLYNNTPASILRGWSGAEGVGMAGGAKYVPQKVPFYILLYWNCYMSLSMSWFLFALFRSELPVNICFTTYDIYIHYCSMYLFREIWCSYIKGIIASCTANRTWHTVHQYRSHAKSHPNGLPPDQEQPKPRVTSHTPQLNCHDSSFPQKESKFMSVQNNKVNFKFLCI